MSLFLILSDSVNQLTYIKNKCNALSHILTSIYSDTFSWFTVPGILVYDMEGEIHDAGLGVTVEGSEQLYSCPRCKKVYRWMISLRRHIRLECGQEPKHPCLYCGRRFKHKHHLIGHVAVHIRRGHQLDPVNIISSSDFNDPSSSTGKREGL
jgi:uncharacterized Zn-finger protein